MASADASPYRSTPGIASVVSYPMAPRAVVFEPRRGQAVPVYSLKMPNTACRRTALNSAAASALRMVRGGTQAAMVASSSPSAPWCACSWRVNGGREPPDSGVLRRF